MEASPHATIRGLEELRDRDLRSELREIHIPTRIFHGVHDRIVPFQLAEEQHRLIGSSSIAPFSAAATAYITMKERSQMRS
jgi:non-heme chloroperoxidase